jgi:hypothetical protein
MRVVSRRELKSRQLADRLLLDLSLAAQSDVTDALRSDVKS